MLEPSAQFRHTQLQAQLELIADAQLIRRVGEVETDSAFIFKHVLIQDTAYQSLLKPERKELHRAVGLTLEQLYPEDQDALAPLLAQHFELAEQDDKAFEYACRAGQVASRVYANAEAIVHFTHALNLVSQDRVTDPARVRAVYLNRGRALELAGRYTEAVANYAEMSKWADTHLEPEMALAALLAESILRNTFTPAYDPKRGKLLAEQALSVSRELGDREGEAKALWNLTLVATFADAEPTQAIAYGEAGLGLARRLNLREQTAYLLNDLFYPYLLTRPLPQAQATLDEALAFWQELDNQPMVTDALASSVLVDYLRGDFDAALEHSQHAYELARATGTEWGQAYALMYTGYVHWDRGDPQSAVDVMADCIAHSIKGGFRTPQVSTRADLGWCYAQLGDAEHGLSLAQAGVAEAEREIPYFAPWASISLARIQVLMGKLDDAYQTLYKGHLNPSGPQRGYIPPSILASYHLARGELALARGNSEEGDRLAQEVLEYLTLHQVRAQVAEARLLRGKTLSALGNAELALKFLDQGAEEAAALGENWQLWQILGQCAALHAQQHETELAAAYNARALPVLRSVLAHTPAEQRAALANTPAARAVLQAAGDSTAADSTAPTNRADAR